MRTLPLLIPLLLFVACAPQTTTHSEPPVTASSTNLVSLPPLGTHAAELELGEELARDAATTSYRGGDAGSRVTVCRATGEVSAVALTRRHPDAPRFRSPEGVTFNASRARAEALLKVSVNLAGVESSGGSTLVARYRDGNSLSYVFDGSRIQEVVLAGSC